MLRKSKRGDSSETRILSYSKLVDVFKCIPATCYRGLNNTLIGSGTESHGNQSNLGLPLKRLCMSQDPYHVVQQEIQTSLQTAENLRASYLRIRSTARGETEELQWTRNEACDSIS